MQQRTLFALLLVFVVLAVSGHIYMAILSSVLIASFDVAASLVARAMDKPKQAMLEVTDALFAHSPTMIAKVSLADWKIQKINETLIKTIGCDHPYQMVGRPMFDLFVKGEEKKL